MNAPEKIASLQVAPGVLWLNPAEPVDLTARARAADAILRQMRRARPVASGMDGRTALAIARARHERSTLRP